MNNIKEKAFRLIAEGFLLLADNEKTQASKEVVAPEPKCTVAPPTEEITAPTPASPKKEVEVQNPKVTTPTPALPVEETTEEAVEEKSLSSDEITQASNALVEGKTYNELRVMTKEMGLPSKGTITALKDRIVEHIIANPNLIAIYNDEATGEVKAVTPAPKKVEAPAPALEVETSTEETGVPDSLATKVFDTLADYTVEEIADILADEGITVAGTKEELMNEVVNLVRSGVISLDDDEEESEEQPKEESIDTEVGYDSPYLDLDYPEKRDTVIEKLVNQTTEAVNSGKLTREKMTKEIGDFFVPEGIDVSKLSDSEFIFRYNEMKIRMIDNDGVTQEFETPYEIGDESLCCGHFLKKIDNEYVCELCGTTYEAE